MEIVVAQIARARLQHGFHLFAWVLMTNHVHLMIRAEDVGVVTVLHSIKAPIGRMVMARWRARGRPCPRRFWQPGGGYDRLIRTPDEFHATLHYLHHNPVRAGLVRTPTDYRWSSARWYAGRRPGQPLTVDRP